MLYPVPAVMVSCGLPDEKPNIITIAWAGTVCSSPAMVSISVRKERYSHHILKESGEFVINLVTEGSGACGRLLRCSFWKRCGQICRDASDSISIQNHCNTWNR